MNRQYLSSLWGKLSALRVRDVWTIAQILVLLGKYLLLRRRRSVPGLICSFDARPRVPPIAPERVERARQLTNSVLRALYGRQFCLARSLILFRLYRKGGHRVRLHLGIARVDGRLTGHAWLAVDGTPVIKPENPIRAYKTIYVYPSSAGAGTAGDWNEHSRRAPAGENPPDPLSPAIEAASFER